jgi:3-hydroxyacyl-CoA dehydrogenase/enoyl-CoA hydratase/3-hydroxybutyryl-CoA epimerase
MSAASPLPIERRGDGIVVLHLTPNPGKPRGGVVVLDAWLIAAIDASLQSIDAMKPKGFLLVSDSERVFVAGADLAEIDALDDSALHAYLRAGSAAFRRISSLPCPSACVIHKAALGGGLELAMHCEALFGVTPPPGDKGWKVGLPECGLHICPGWGGTVLLPARIEPVTAIAATMHGAPFEASQPPHGLFESVFAGTTAAHAAAITWLLANPRSTRRSEPRNACEALRVTATRQAIPFVRPQAAHAASIAVIDAVQAGCEGGFDAAVEREQLHLVDLRHTPEARRKLDAFLKR